MVNTEPASAGGGGTDLEAIEMKGSVVGNCSTHTYLSKGLLSVKCKCVYLHMHIYTVLDTFRYIFGEAPISGNAKASRPYSYIMKTSLMPKTITLQYASIY